MTRRCLPSSEQWKTTDTLSRYNSFYSSKEGDSHDSHLELIFFWTLDSWLISNLPMIIKINPGLNAHWRDSWGLGLWSQKQGSFYIFPSLPFHCSPLGYPSIVLLLFSPFPIVLLFSCSIVLLCSFLLCPLLLFLSLLFSPLRLFSIVLLIVCTVWAIPYCSTYLLFYLGIYRDPCTVVLPSSNLLGFPLKG